MRNQQPGHRPEASKTNENLSIQAPPTFYYFLADNTLTHSPFADTSYETIDILPTIHSRKMEK